MSRTEGSIALPLLQDCNQRDERLGWMGDAALSAEEAAFNFGKGGIMGTHTQFLDMIADGQAATGEVSDITPTVWQIGPMQPADPNWGSAYPTIAHTVFSTWAFVSLRSIAPAFLGAVPPPHAPPFSFLTCVPRANIDRCLIHCNPT